MRLRAHCTMELWGEASRSPDAFADWFCKLAVENSKEAVRKQMVSEGNGGREAAGAEPCRISRPGEEHSASQPASRR